MFVNYCNNTLSKHRPDFGLCKRNVTMSTLIRNAEFRSTLFVGGSPICFIFYILNEFRNAPFYIHCLFHMDDLSMFPSEYHVLSSYTMDHDLP